MLDLWGRRVGFADSSTELLDRLEPGIVQRILPCEPLSRVEVGQSFRQVLQFLIWRCSKIYYIPGNSPKSEGGHPRALQSNFLHETQDEPWQPHLVAQRGIHHSRPSIISVLCPGIGLLFSLTCLKCTRSSSSLCVFSIMPVGRPYPDRVSPQCHARHPANETHQNARRQTWTDLGWRLARYVGSCNRSSTNTVLAGAKAVPLSTL